MDSQGLGICCGRRLTATDVTRDRKSLMKRHGKPIYLRRQHRRAVGRNNGGSLLKTPNVRMADYDALAAAAYNQGLDIPNS
jgi:hypothetical protein